MSGETPAREAEDLVAAAQRLQPLLEAHAEESERAGNVAGEVIDALRESGILAMYLPRELGGADLTLSDAMRVLKAVAYGDASTAWVTMALAGTTAFTSVLLSEDALGEMFGSAAFPGVAGQGTRPQAGTAKPVKGGYLLSGDWQFASGIKHARYVGTAALVEGTGEPRFFVLPVDQAHYTDNWDVLGLLATGSIDYSIRDAFVPEAYSASIAPPPPSVEAAVSPANSQARQPLPGERIRKSGLTALVASGHAAWAAGAARRLLDEVALAARESRGRAGQRKNNPAFHADYASAEARFRAAEALMFQTWADIDETADRGEVPSTRQETLIRLALNHITWTAYEVSVFAFKATATLAVRRGLVNRLIRDIQTGATHVSSSQPLLESAGQELLELQPGSRWLGFQLAPPRA